MARTPVVGAARHYDRIVQQGSQARSSTALQDGVKKMRDGSLATSTWLVDYVTSFGTRSAERLSNRRPLA